MADENKREVEQQDDGIKREKVRVVPLSAVKDFPNHPFQVKDDDSMQELIHSIEVNGVLNPVIARKTEQGDYELISGHRRKHACEVLGIERIPIIVREISRDEAVIAMVDSNLQRENILPSEKAFAYKMRLEAMNRQGKRSDLTSGPLGQKLSRQELSDSVGESERQIHRYIRLTELIPELLDMVDEGEIAMRPAVELSYIPKLKQGEIWQRMEMEQCTPSHAQTIRMRRLADEGKLTPEVIEAIMIEEKPNQKERIVLRGDRFNSLFPPDLPISKREDYVAAAMEFYGRHRQRQRERDDGR